MQLAPGEECATEHPSDPAGTVGGAERTARGPSLPNAQSQVQVDDGYLIALAKQGDRTATTASCAATTASSA